MFYACALAVALTKRTRAAAGCARVYPGALARTMNLCLVLLRRPLPGAWAYEDGHQTARISEAAIRAVIAPTMAAATHLCAAACTNVGLGRGQHWARRITGPVPVGHGVRRGAAGARL